MSTSGSIDYNMTGRGLVTFALRLINITDRLDQPAAEDMESGLEAMTLMLKSWQVMGPNLWRNTFGSVALVAGQASYTLSPKPFSVEEARFRSASGTDIPMTQMNRDDYVDIPAKTSTGTPTSYYIDRQRDSVVMYVWPVPSAVTTETVQYSYSRIIEDMDNADNDIDIPQEWFETVGYNLASRLLDTFQIDNSRVSKRAEYLLAVANSYDREAIVRFEPGHY